jgi:hypothetical protein
LEVFVWPERGHAMATTSLCRVSLNSAVEMSFVRSSTRYALRFGLSGIPLALPTDAGQRRAFVQQFPPLSRNPFPTHLEQLIPPQICGRAGRSKSFIDLHRPGSRISIGCNPADEQGMEALYCLATVPSFHNAAYGQLFAQADLPAKPRTLHLSAAKRISQRCKSGDAKATSNSNGRPPWARIP